jgi:hypothetical protein
MVNQYGRKKYSVQSVRNCVVREQIYGILGCLELGGLPLYNLAIASASQPTELPRLTITVSVADTSGDTPREMALR